MHGDERDDLIRELKEAIEKSFNDSTDINEIMAKIHEQGFGISLGVFVMVTLQQDGEEVIKSLSTIDDLEDFEDELYIELNKSDIDFLKSLNIKPPDLKNQH